MSVKTPKTLVSRWRASLIGKISRRISTGYNHWLYARRMKRAHALLKRCAPVYVNMVGTDKNGTLRKIRNLEYDLKRGQFKWKAIKLARGLQTNVHAKQKG